MTSQTDTVHRLLSAASAALETDTQTARACLIEVSALLRLPGERRKRSQETPRGGLAPFQIRRLTEYVRRHIDGRIRIHDLARLAGLSTSHFSRAFRQSFGEPPMQYVSSQRVERAKELMLAPQSNLAEIALACGLCDQAHLSRVFRRVVGATPSCWRRRVNGATQESAVIAA